MKRAVMTLAATAVIGITIYIPNAAAQQGATLSAKLTAFPAFIGPADTLRFSIEATNDGSAAAGDLRVAIAFHEEIKNRSQLDRTFAARPSLTSFVGGDTFSVDGVIAPGETRTISLEKALTDITFFRSTRNNRAYPVRITLSSGRSSARAISTHMIFFSPDPQPPLEIALVVPLHVSSMYTDGSAPNVVTSPVLERAVSGGRISRILSALDAHPEVAVTLAPSGQLLDMLQDLSDGYTKRSGGATRRVASTEAVPQQAAKILDQIQKLTARENTKTMIFPYSGTVLPVLVREELSARAQAQVGQTRQRIDDDPRNEGALLKVAPLRGWILPSKGLLDEPTVAELQLSGISNLIVSPSSITGPELPLTRGEPVRLKTRTNAPVTALIADAGLGRRLEHPEGVDDIPARQRFLAETMTIMVEQPALQRAVVAAAPDEWAPSAGILDGLVTALSSSPWIKSTTPDAVLRSITRTSPGRVEVAATESVLGSTPGLVVPPDDYFDAIKRAQTDIKRYSDLDPPRQRLAQLEHRLLVAESSDWWTRRSRIEQGHRFASSIGPAIDAEFERIKAPTRQTITLTSRTGVIPLSIHSELDYPVNIVVRLESDKLGFPDSDGVRPCRAGDTQKCLFIDRLEPRAGPIEVKTTAKATGTFPLRVVIETPGQRVAIDEGDLTIRSTDFNVVGVLITAGAAVFLVSWWLASLARKTIPA